MSINLAKRLVMFGLAMVLAGCAQTSHEQQISQTNGDAIDTNQTNIEYVDERDPFETFNRKSWDFNWDILDEYVLRPLAVGYSEYLPRPAQTGVRNFVTNLEEPGYAVNSLLQGKIKHSGKAAGRFLINSTIGILGLFDVADYIGMERHKEDFGQTMAVYGVGNGPFVMVPAYGPTTFRDGAGDLIDGQIFPMYLFDWPVAILKTGIKAVYTRADLIPQEGMIENSVDPYVFVKEVYYQNQNFKIHDGNPPLEEPEEFDEAFLDEID